jgi:hypothetical protein
VNVTGVCDPSQYYEDRPVPHTAQGDLYADVPVALAENPPERDRPRGGRKRPRPRREMVDYAVVCNYTCGFVAQPPGSKGYSHMYRLVAPVLPLEEVVGQLGVTPSEARRLVSLRLVNGLMWLPPPPGCTSTGTGEFSDDWVAALYAMTAVHQERLDECTRVGRLSMPAQKILISGLIQVMSPNLYDPTDTDDPDMSCSWPQS